MHVLHKRGRKTGWTSQFNQKPANWPYLWFSSVNCMVSRVQTLANWLEPVSSRTNWLTGPIPILMGLCANMLLSWKLEHFNWKSAKEQKLGFKNHLIYVFDSFSLVLMIFFNLSANHLWFYCYYYIDLTVLLYCN